MRYISPDGRTRYAGKWRGRVTNVEDPKEQGRLRCIITDVYGSVESPWCLPQFPAAMFGGVALGSQVWVEFEQHDSDRPIWCGVCPSSASGAQAAAPTAIAKDDETTAVGLGKGGGKVSYPDPEAESGTRDFVEPITTAKPKYPNVQTLRVGQNYIEVDGTEGEARIHLYHESGAYFEIGKTGQIKTKARGSKKTWIEGQAVRSVSGEDVGIIGGDGKYTFKKRRRIDVKRDSTETIGGAETRIIGGRKREAINGAVLPTVESGAFEQYIAGKAVREADQISDTSLGDRSELTLGTKNSLIVGPYLVTIQNKDFATGQNVGYGLSLSLGDIQWDAVTGSIKLKGAGVTAPTLELDKTGAITIKNAVGGKAFLSVAGKWTIGNNGAELLDLFDQLIQSLISTTVNTMLGPQPLSVSLDTTLAQIKARLALIKG